MTHVRWGIIGCGDVTEVKSGPALQKASNSSLVAVMRRDGAKAADYAKRHNVPAWYDDADKLIHDPNVDIVYVATPPGSHAEYCIRAAKASKPVYVEKPMARTADECRQMIDACRSANVKLFVAYYRRCLPRFVKAKELIDSGAIGRLQTVSAVLWKPPSKAEMDGTAWRIDPVTAGGGLLLDLASHTLDLIDHLCGPIESAAGQAMNTAGLYTAEDTVTGTWRHAGGALGSGCWCYAAGTHRDSVDIVGTKGLIRFSTFGEQPVELITAERNEAFTLANPPHVHQPLVQTIVDELTGQGVCPSTGESALRTNIALDAMLATWRAK